MPVLSKRINDLYDALMFAKSPQAARNAAQELVRVVLARKRTTSLLKKLCGSAAVFCGQRQTRTSKPAMKRSLLSWPCGRVGHKKWPPEQGALRRPSFRPDLEMASLNSAPFCVTAENPQSFCPFPVPPTPAAVPLAEPACLFPGEFSHPGPGAVSRRPSE